jgi:lipopolysaccharide/colanic/teichoic acid biosynthesis glycosyltransferase
MNGFDPPSGRDAAASPLLAADPAGGAPSAWYPLAKRAFDIVFAVVGLIVLAPLGVCAALLIKLADRGPILYRQERVGLGGRLFWILKFRTMRPDADKLGPTVTRDSDPRITQVGAILRKLKLDELPQLWNVLRGEMSFVGPRPEVPRYVARYTAEQRALLDHKPGITDLATLVFRDEQTLLRSAADVEEFYVRHCIPRKFHLNQQYARRANVMEDTLIILETLCPYWLGVVCGYALTLGASLWLAYQLRFDFAVPEKEMVSMDRLMFPIVSLQVGCLIWRKQVVGLLSYFDLAEMKQLAYGLGLAAAIQMLGWYVTEGDLMPPRGVIVIHTVLSFVAVAGTRILLRSVRERRRDDLGRTETYSGALSIGIVGAGELGGWLARQLNDRTSSRRRVEAFFDDDADKWNKVLYGVRVVGMPECLLDGSWAGKLDEVILAVPSATPERLEQIKKVLGSASIRVRTMPTLEELLK